MTPTRWFDENGDEIIREPINLDETEQIAEIGGNFEEFSVGINFYSKHLDKDEITKIIGVQPTKAWNQGEKHQVGNSKKTRITEWGKWYLMSKRDSTDLNIKLKDLLGSLTSDLEKWNILTSKYESWIDIAGYMKNWNRGFSLKPDVLKMISDRNIEVVFDIYYDEENDNE